MQGIWRNGDVRVLSLTERGRRIRHTSDIREEDSMHSRRDEKLLRDGSELGVQRAVDAA
jgi:hypothetical protein